MLPTFTTSPRFCSLLKARRTADRCASVGSIASSGATALQKGSYPRGVAATTPRGVGLVCYICSKQSRQMLTRIIASVHKCSLTRPKLLIGRKREMLDMQG